MVSTGSGSGAVESERALGRTIIAELPTDDDLVLFSEDRIALLLTASGRSTKIAIAAVRVLINGVPIAAAVSPRRAHRQQSRYSKTVTGFGLRIDPPEGSRATAGTWRSKR